MTCDDLWIIAFVSPVLQDKNLVYERMHQGVLFRQSRNKLCPTYRVLAFVCCFASPTPAHRNRKADNGDLRALESSALWKWKEMGVYVYVSDL